MSAEAKIMAKLSESSNLLYTTHSLSFIPKDRNNILGVKKEQQRTNCVNFRSTREATELLRRDLGVKVSDFFNSSGLSIGVEGPTNKQYMGWFLKEHS
jgi:hypothetical protein